MEPPIKFVDKHELSRHGRWIQRKIEPLFYSALYPTVRITLTGQQPERRFFGPPKMLAPLVGCFDSLTL